MNSSSNQSLPATGRVALLSAGLVLLAGCGSYPEEHVVSAPPPAVVTAPATQQVVVTQPGVAATVVTATPLANGTLLVTQAPPTAPAVVVDSRPARPSSAHVWLEGYWAWRNDRYEWVSAHWETPPHTNASWIPPRWEKRADGNYTFYAGYWN